MKKMKIILTVLLSVMLMFTISTAVFADNEVSDDIWTDINEAEGENTENTENSTDETENESMFENVEVENEVEEDVEVEESNNEYSNLYSNTNSTTTNSENLADTGIADSGMIALIVMISGIVAIYSAKKFNDYKNV